MASFTKNPVIMDAANVIYNHLAKFMDEETIDDIKLLEYVEHEDAVTGIMENLHKEVTK